MNDPTATRPTDAQIAHVARMLAGFESVTTFLRALSTVVSVDRDDPEGGHLLACCVSLWRAHERGGPIERLEVSPSWLPPTRPTERAPRGDR